MADRPLPTGTVGQVSDRRADLRLAAWLVVSLSVLGAVLGLAWSWWAGPQQRAYVIAPGELYPYDEVETMAGADARYLLIVACVGLLAALALWAYRPALRGALAVTGLAAGGLAGAALTWAVGRLTDGGTYSGRTGTVIAHLPLTLHMRGVLFVEPALAVLVYGVLVAFAARDDLGRADPVRDRAADRGGRHAAEGDDAVQVPQFPAG